MRKLTALALLTAALTLTACGNSQQSDTDKPAAAEKVVQAFEKSKEQRFTEGFRESFGKAVSTSCLAAAEQAKVASAEAQTLCTCAAEKAVGALSDADILRIQEEGADSPVAQALRQKAEKAADTCRR
ncbi:hypothetical protein [Neisseria perflava]|uniref:hypothetical protein n=1 Tax=Neisseria perflava TaxID=33053 RepID=UPI00209E9B27|nr:hypothetical protein [Neisseria perflava]MCP1659643.1 outer membrane lipopolysaccharide assembly protein LptE/RlpB [Neisseria perflava]MCP1771337.1 outer membrane lipopolysaccharide assembly protein LptE/RlpB [Neisseria perflava]